MITIDMLEQRLRDLAKSLSTALGDAQINYRIVGGMAAFLHVDAVEPIAARLTPDVDLAIDRVDLPRVAQAVRPLGLELGFAKGIDVLSGLVFGRVRTVGHLVFVGEKVRPAYPEAIPIFSLPVVTPQGLLLSPVADLVRMKLTSNRLIDKVHIIDMDGVGLITPEIGDALPEALRQRLQKVREEERQSAGAE